MRALALLVCILLSPAVNADEVDAFAAGLAAFERGEFADAARQLEIVHRAAPDDAEVDLLLGICYFRLHRLDDAAPLLEHAATSPEPDSVASARLFLALIALERDDRARADQLLDRVARSPTGELAATARLIREGGAIPPVLFVFILRPEYDSNVPLQSIAPLSGEPIDQVDGALIAVASLTWRPVRRLPFTIEPTLLYRRLARLTDFDLGLASVTLRWAGTALSASASGEGMLLGGDPYAAGAGGQLGYRLRVSDAVVPWARYTARGRAYDPPAYAGYTGLTHAGLAGVTLGGGGRGLHGDLGYTLGQELTRDDALTTWFHGPTAELGWRRGRVDLTAGGSLAWRRYDGRRRDRLTTASATVGVDVTTAFGLLGGVALLDNASNDDAFAYRKLTAYLGAYLVLAP